MKLKRFLASMLCVAMVVQSDGVFTFADTNTTSSDFTATSEILGNDLIVTIPDEVPLTKVDDNFVGSGTVTAKGITNPIAILSVSTNPVITYENQSNTDICVEADVVFGTDCTAIWTASELRDNITAEPKLGYEVTATVPFSEIKYIGEYKTNILFDIELSTTASAVTYYMGYDYSDGSDIDYANETDIDYDILPQTDTVAELKEFSTDKDAIEAKGYDKVIESSEASLVIPSTIDGNEVIGVSFNTFFADESIATYVNEIEVPSSVTGVELSDTISSASTTVITCENVRTAVKLSKKIPSTARIRFQFEANGERDYTEFFSYKYKSSYDGYAVKGFTEYGYNQLASYGADTTVEITLPMTYNGKSVVGIEIQGYDDGFSESLTSADMPNQEWILADSYKYCNGFWNNSTFNYNNPCTKLKNIVFNEGLESINSDAFRYCTNLERIVIPASVTSIGSYAFAYCSSLTDVIITEGCSCEFSENVFYKTNIKCITLPSSIARIDGRTFGNSDLVLKKIIWNVNHADAVIKESNKFRNVYITYSDGNYFGYGDSAVKALADSSDGITATVTTNVADEAFKDKAEGSAYEKLIIAEGVTSIGDKAFSGVTIPDIELPSTLTNVGSKAFYAVNVSELDLRNVTSAGESMLKYATVDTLVINSAALPAYALEGTTVKNLYINYTGSSLVKYSTNNMNIDALEHIYFSGTEEEWVTFIGSETKNNLTVSMTNITFNATMPE